MFNLKVAVGENKKTIFASSNCDFRRGQHVLSCFEVGEPGGLVAVLLPVDLSCMDALRVYQFL